MGNEAQQNTGTAHDPQVHNLREVAEIARPPK